MLDLKTREGMVARALEVAIHCASRRDGVRGAVWSVHVLASTVEAPYLRGDALEQQRPMMADWAEFCADSRTLTVADFFRGTDQAA